MLLEEYIGLGDYAENGGWIGHFYRDRMEEYRLHFPFRKDDEGGEDENGNPRLPQDPRTPQEQEAALQAELKADEERMRKIRDRGS